MLAALALATQIAIIGYHEVDAVPRTGWSLPTEEFRDEMAFLATTGYHVIPIGDLYDYLAGKRDFLPPNPVVLTVDDGFLCAYTDVRPILQEFRFPWSLYVYPAIVGAASHALSWAQIEELSASGVDIEGHTMTHAHLMRRSHAGMSDADYSAWLHNELAGSKTILEEKLGRPVRFLAYPYGDHDFAVEKEAAADGYLLGLTSERGLNTPATNPLELKRFPVVSDTTLDQFRDGIGAAPLRLRDLSPEADGVIDGSQRAVSALISDAAELDPKSVRMTVLGVRHGFDSYDPKSGEISFHWKGKLSPGRHRAIVWGDTSGGERHASVWSFYTSDAAKAHYEAMRKELLALPLHHTETTRQPPR
jgi:peptidoglycan/xylan/chitin deacetylase (PgdA/CDA1 family)